MSIGFKGGRALPPPPSPATVRKMMDFIAGADIPEHYVPFLTEELALDGRTTKSRNGIATAAAAR